MWCIMPLNSAEINKTIALTPVIPQSLSTKKKTQIQTQSQLHLWCILLKCSYTKDFIMFSFLPGSIGNCTVKSNSFSEFLFCVVVVEGFSSRSRLVSYFTSTSSLLSFYPNSIAKYTSVIRFPQGCIASSSTVSLCILSLWAGNNNRQCSAVLESRLQTKDNKPHIAMRHLASSVCVANYDSENHLLRIFESGTV